MKTLRRSLFRWSNFLYLGAIIFAVVLILLLPRDAFSQPPCYLYPGVLGSGSVEITIGDEEYTFTQGDYVWNGLAVPCQTSIQVIYTPNLELGWKIARISLGNSQLPVLDNTGFSASIELLSGETEYFTTYFVPTQVTDLSETWRYVKASVNGAGHIVYNPSHAGYNEEHPEVTMTCVPDYDNVIVNWSALYCEGYRCYSRPWFSISPSHTFVYSPPSSSSNDVYTCQVAALDPPGNNGTCPLRIYVRGGGDVSGNGEQVNIVTAGAALSFECGSAVLLEFEPFSGWIPDYITAGGTPIIDLVRDLGEFYVTPGEVNIWFDTIDHSGIYWVGASTTPEGHAEITRNPDKTGYIDGDTLNLSCIPDEGYRFVDWKSYFRHVELPEVSTEQDLEFVVRYNSSHECRVEPVSRRLSTEAIVFPANAPSYTDNGLISVSPDTGGIYDHGTDIQLSSAAPNVSSQYCSLNWYWYVPDVSPDWHLLPDHRQTIPVNMDHDKWFRAEWICSLDEPTPTPTPTESPTAEPTQAPTATPPPNDDMCGITLSTIGSGSIQYGEYGTTSNAAVRVPCDEEMVFVARPDAGWRFTHFEIERGTEQTTVPASPHSWTVQDGDRIMAFFTPGADSIYLPTIRR